MEEFINDYSDFLSPEQIRVMKYIDELYPEPEVPDPHALDLELLMKVLPIALDALYGGSFNHYRWKKTT